MATGPRRGGEERGSEIAKGKELVRGGVSDWVCGFVLGERDPRPKPTTNLKIDVSKKNGKSWGG